MTKRDLLKYTTIIIYSIGLVAFIMFFIWSYFISAAISATVSALSYAVYQKHFENYK